MSTVLSGGVLRSPKSFSGFAPPNNCLMSCVADHVPHLPLITVSAEGKQTYRSKKDERLSLADMMSLSRDNTCNFFYTLFSCTFFCFKTSARVR